jgi:hypothetical protein
MEEYDGSKSMELLPFLLLATIFFWVKFLPPQEPQNESARLASLRPAENIHRGEIDRCMYRNLQ